MTSKLEQMLGSMRTWWKVSSPLNQVGPNHSTAGPLKIANELCKELSFSSFFHSQMIVLLISYLDDTGKAPSQMQLCRWTILKQLFFHAGKKKKKLGSNSRPNEICILSNVKNQKTDQELRLLWTTVLFTEVHSPPASNFNTDFVNWKLVNSLYMKPMIPLYINISSFYISLVGRLFTL